MPAAQTRDKDAVSPDDMIALTNQLRAEFDYVLVDSPAGIEAGFRNAIAGADEVLIVTTPEVSAVRDADRIIGLVEAFEKGHPRPDPQSPEAAYGQPRRDDERRGCACRSWRSI